MTLTLDQIRDTKFHVAKRGGYEVTEVDRFVDQVEESFAVLTEENTGLKKQVDSLKSAQSNAQRAGQQSAQSNDKATAQLTEENAALKKQVETLQVQVESAQASARAANAQVQQQQQQQTQEQTRVVQAVPASQSVQQPVAKGANGAEKLVVTTTPEASAAVVRLVQLHTEQAERLVGEAESEARRKIEEANQKAHQITTDARTRADRIESEARVNAEKLTEVAQRNAEELGRQVEVRRVELFRDLEGERDQLQSSVEQLRSFEDQYRRNFSKELNTTLENIGAKSNEPADVPSLAKRTGAAGSGQSANSPQSVSKVRSASGGTTDTPRLDALLGDGNR